MGGVLQVFLQISQYLQENTCASLFLTKLQACKFIKTKLQHRYFPIKYCEIFKNTYFVEHLQTAASKTVDAAANINAIESMFFFISMHSRFVLFYPFQTNVAFHRETSHLICNANQITIFHLNCNIGLNKVNWKSQEQK